MRLSIEKNDCPTRITSCGYTMYEEYKTFRESHKVKNIEKIFAVINRIKNLILEFGQDFTDHPSNISPLNMTV